MLMLCLGSFLSVALYIFTVYNFTCNYSVFFIRMVPFFFSIRANQRINCHFLTNELGDLQCNIISLEIEKLFSFCQTTINQFLVKEKEKKSEMPI